MTTSEPVLCTKGCWGDGAEVAWRWLYAWGLGKDSRCAARPRWEEEAGAMDDEGTRAGSHAGKRFCSMQLCD